MKTKLEDVLKIILPLLDDVLEIALPLLAIGMTIAFIIVLIVGCKSL